MSEARRCDRCNEFYSINDINEKRGEYPITASYKKRVGSITLYDNNVNRIKHLDLCPKCSRSLIVWLNDWGQEVKDCYKCKYHGIPEDYNYCGECDENYSKFEPKEDSE